MSTLKETLYVGRDNTIRIALYEDEVLFHTAYPDVTPSRWVLTIDATVIDSDTTPTAFNWDETTSVLELNLGTLITTAFDYTASILVMYAVPWPNGLVWFNPTCTPTKLLIRSCDNS